MSEVSNKLWRENIEIGQSLLALNNCKLEFGDEGP